MAKPKAWRHAPGKASRQARGYGAAWDRLRATILQRDLYVCQQCKRDGALRPAHSVDHIKPKAEGGGDDPTNLEALCRPCHMEKTRAESCRARGVALPRKRGPTTAQWLGIGEDGWPIE